MDGFTRTTVIVFLIIFFLSGCTNRVFVAVPGEIRELKREMRRDARASWTAVTFREISLKEENGELKLPAGTWWFGPAGMEPEGTRIPEIDRRGAFQELGALIAAEMVESGDERPVCILARIGGERVQREIDALVDGLELPSVRLLVHRYGDSAQVNRVVDEVLEDPEFGFCIVLMGAQSPEVMVELTERGGPDIGFASEFLTEYDASNLSKLVNLRFGLSLDYESFFISVNQSDSEGERIDAQVVGRISRY